MLGATSLTRLSKELRDVAAGKKYTGRTAKRTDAGGSDEDTYLDDNLASSAGSDVHIPRGLSEAERWEYLERMEERTELREQRKRRSVFGVFDVGPAEPKKPAKPKKRRVMKHLTWLSADAASSTHNPFTAATTGLIDPDSKLVPKLKPKHRAAALTAYVAGGIL